MDKSIVRKLFVILSGGWVLVMFVQYGAGMSLSTFMTLDFLPVSILWIIYFVLMLSVKKIKDAVEVKAAVAAVPQKTKQSALELYEIEKVKAEQKEVIPYEIASRMKNSTPPKKDVLSAALEEIKKKKSFK